MYSLYDGTYDSFLPLIVLWYSLCDIWFWIQKIFPYLAKLFICWNFSLSWISTQSSTRTSIYWRISLWWKLFLFCQIIITHVCMFIQRNNNQKQKLSDLNYSWYVLSQLFYVITYFILDIIFTLFPVHRIIWNLLTLQSGEMSPS